MGSANRRVPGDEDADPHDGSTGFQAESGASIAVSRRRRRRKAARAPRMISGENRFTERSLRPSSSLESPTDLINKS
jgi:hypothetical protein